MNLDAKFYAGQFRELADRFKELRPMNGSAAAIATSTTMTAAGELFIDAVKSGHLDSLGGARKLIDEYSRAKSKSDAGERVAFIGGCCIRLPPNAPAVRAICPANLFGDVAGNDAIQVLNEGGKLTPTGVLPPNGLLPNLKPALFPPAPYGLLRITVQGDEGADFARLAQEDTNNRFSRACQLLAEALDSTPTAPEIAEVDEIDKKAGKLIWLAKAMLAVQEHPDWKDAKIAIQVGVDKSTLSRSEVYQLAASRARGDTHSIPKGRVTIDPESKTHDVEAVARAAGESCDTSDRGQPIPRSKYFQEYCDLCKDPVRVARDQVGKNPRCEKCQDL